MEFKRFFMVWLLCCSLLIALAPPVEAAPFCRMSNGQNICILTIKRSAKNYWEYRAAVSVDGVERPIEVYNCRDRIRLRKDGPPVPFTRDEAGPLICNVLKK